MCNKFIFKNQYKELELIESDQLKDTYTHKYQNKSLKLTIIKDTSKILGFEKLDKLKSKYLGVEKIIDFSFDNGQIEITTENNFRNIELTKNYFEIANLGVNISNTVKNLYNIDINQFNLSSDKIAYDNNNNLIIKDVFILSENNNHIFQLGIILDYYLGLNSLEKNSTYNALKVMIEKCLNNSYKDINELKRELSYFIQIHVPLRFVNVSKTNPYTDIDIESINKISIKCNSLINKIKSDKIINFNFNNQHEHENNFNDFDWLIELEKNIKTSEKFHYTSENNNLRKVLSLEKSFSGVVIINEELHIFCYQGYITGALNIHNLLKNDNALSEVKGIKNVEFKPTDSNFPIIVSNLINSGLSIIDNTIYSNNDLIESIEKLTKTNFSGYLLIKIDDYKIFVIYDNGKNVFNILEQDNHISLLNNYSLNRRIKDTISEISLETYTLKFNILNISVEDIILKSRIEVKQINQSQGDLKDILKLGNEHLSNKLKEAIIGNITLNKLLPVNEKIEILDGELNISDLIDDSVLYKFVKWFIFELFFKIKNTNNIEAFKNFYMNIPLINKINFSVNENSIRIFLNKDDKLLFICQYGDGSLNNFEQFIDYTKKLKAVNGKKQVVSAVYISDKEFSNDMMLKYKDITKTPSFKIIGFNKQKSYVKVSNSLGYTLMLVNSKDSDFKISAPLF